MPIDKTKLQSVDQVYPLKVAPYEEYMTVTENPSVVAKLNAMLQSLHQMGRLTNQTVAQWNRVMDWIVNGGMDDIATNITTKKIEVALKEMFDMLDLSLNTGLKDLTLSVVEEKINTMLEDGQFENLISSSIVNIHNEVKTEIESIKQSVGKIASATPLFVNNVSEMNNHGKLYVNKSDGFLYASIDNVFVSTNVLYQARGIENKSVNHASMNYRYLTGIIKQGTINFDTVKKEIVASGNAGVYVDSTSKYYVYTDTQVVPFPLANAIFSLYFNIISLKYVVYVRNETMVDPANLVYICTFWGSDNIIEGSVQRKDVITLNGSRSDDGKTSSFLITGSIAVNTSLKTITISASNVVTTDGTTGTTGTESLRTISYSHLDSTRGINLSWNNKTSDFEVYGYSDMTQKGLYLFGTLYAGKIHGCLSREFVTVNGIKNAGFGETVIPVNPNQRLKTPQEIYYEFLKMTDEEIEEVLVGDSITHGAGGTGYDITSTGGGTLIPTTTVYTSPNSVSWANMLKNDVVKLDSRIKTTNHGISGKDSLYVNNNKEALIPTTAKLVILKIGTNDTIKSKGLTMKQFIANIQSIIDYCVSKNILIILISGFPFISNSSTSYDKSMYQINYGIKMASNSRGLQHINLHDKVIRYCKDKGIELSSLLRDGLHPNDLGYAVMYQMITEDLGISRSTY